MPILNFAPMLDRLGDWNPQFYREVKSRYRQQNIAIITGLALLSQVMVLYFFNLALPGPKETTNRYCLGSPPPGWNEYSENSYATNHYCIKNFLGDWITNWQLWWLDVFITVSVLGIGVLLVVGVYLLITDLSQENTRGTLNFIRLSPRSAQTIFWGKFLGVPSLLYGFLALYFPLHFLSALAAKIPLSLLLSFYAVVASATLFFFWLALLFALEQGKANFGQAFAVSSFLAIMLLIMTVSTLQDGHAGQYYLWDWLGLFYPGRALSYLAQGTFLPDHAFNYLSAEHLTNLVWYGQPLFDHPISGMGFMIVNFSIWGYWFSQAIDRHFRSPHRSSWSKAQTYLITLSFVVMVAGFLFQEGNSIRGIDRAKISDLRDNFVILQFFIWTFFLFLINALCLNRSTLRDWARYRHQAPSPQRSLLWDLLWGETSPPVLAIAVNLGIVLLYLTPMIFWAPQMSHRLALGLGLFLGLSFIFMLSLIFQYATLTTRLNRLMVGTGLILVSSLAPLAIAVVFGTLKAQVMWFSFLPTAASRAVTVQGIFLSLLAQLGLMATTGLLLQRHLKRLGRSESFVLSSGAQASLTPR